MQIMTLTHDTVAYLSTILPVVTRTNIFTGRKVICSLTSVSRHDFEKSWLKIYFQHRNSAKRNFLEGKTFTGKNLYCF